MMALVICPGIHDPLLTDHFLAALNLNQHPLNSWYVLPTHRYPPFSAVHVLHFVAQHCRSSHGPATDQDTLTFLAYSAGVVGAMGAAWAWQQQGGYVEAMIAIDGWGVPHLGSFPLYRLSHDVFTHRSSGWLGAGLTNFYADPPVPHLHLWQHPQGVPGWAVRQRSLGTETRSSTTAITFIRRILAQHYL